DLAADRARASLAMLAALAVLASRSPVSQVRVIAVAGLVGWKGLPASETAASTPVDVPVSRRVAVGALALFFALLVGLPIARHVAAHHALAVFDSFYRAGALLFAAGHLVLPLLHAPL